MHYAAVNDNAKLIETIFLVAKTEPKPIQEPSTFEQETYSDDVEGLSGNIDDRFNDMRE